MSEIDDLIAAKKNRKKNGASGLTPSPTVTPPSAESPIDGNADEKKPTKRNINDWVVGKEINRLLLLDPKQFRVESKTAPDMLTQTICGLIDKAQAVGDIKVFQGLIEMAGAVGEQERVKPNIIKSRSELSDRLKEICAT